MDGSNGCKAAAEMSIEEAESREEGLDGVGVVDRNEDGGLRARFRRGGSLLGPGSGASVAPYDADRGANEGVVERGNENGMLRRGRVGVRYECGSKLCLVTGRPRWAGWAEGTIISERVLFGGGLLTGIRLP